MRRFGTAVAAALGVALAGSAWADSHNRRSDLQPGDEAKPAQKQPAAKKQDKAPIVLADSHNRRKDKDKQK